MLELTLMLIQFPLDAQTLTPVLMLVSTRIPVQHHLAVRGHCYQCAAIPVIVCRQSMAKGRDPTSGAMVPSESARL